MSHYDEQIEKKESVKDWLQQLADFGQEYQPEFYESVNHPKHYTSHPSGVECIQITEHLTFCLGSAIKYIFRCDYKGKKIEDLKKAVWYIEREIERLSKLGE